MLTNVTFAYIEFTSIKIVWKYMHLNVDQCQIHLLMNANLTLINIIYTCKLQNVKSQLHIWRRRKLQWHLKVYCTTREKETGRRKQGVHQRETRCEDMRVWGGKGGRTEGEDQTKERGSTKVEGRNLLCLAIRVRQVFLFVLPSTLILEGLPPWMFVAVRPCLCEA